MFDPTTKALSGRKMHCSRSESAPILMTSRSSFRKIAMICGAKAMPTMEPINSTQKARLTVNQKALRTRP